MQNNELLLHYQPKVSLLTGNVVGAEALVRWADSQHGILAPNQFLPLVESSGLLHELTLQLLDQVIDACSSLKKHPLDLALSINVAPDDLASNTISSKIGRALLDGKIGPNDLQVEITESAVMGNVDRVYEDLCRLKLLGIRILMDDFGTGYSSIDRLSQLPFDSLKLDQGVVRRMNTSWQNLDVVRSAISMARELGMTSVAEGIECAEAYHFLIAQGCEEAQGFYIARPMSLQDFKSFLDADHDFHGSQIGRVHQACLNLIRFRKMLLDAAYCRSMGDGVTLESVADPGLCTDMSQSRLGIWYFGSKHALGSYPVFLDMEKPLREVHTAGIVFLERLNKAGGANEIKNSLVSIDQKVSELVELFQQLERALLEKAAP